jgi:hypothetical protein
MLIAEENPKLIDYRKRSTYVYDYKFYSYFENFSSRLYQMY